MKTLLTLTLVFYTANGFGFTNIFSRDEEISHLAVSCVGVPDGTKLPDETNCQKFTLCDGGLGLLLTCRSSDPYFYRCNSTCTNEMSLCNVMNCPGETTTGTTTTGTTTTTTGTTSAGATTPTTTTSTVTATQTTTTPTTLGTTTTTTTRLIIPTVPIGCTPSCAKTYNTAVCPCVERWVCVNQKCECSATKTCPVSRLVCEGTTAEGCGCPERCDCTGEVGDEKCYCRDDVICPFNKNDCGTKCDCVEQCDDSVCTEDEPAGSGTFTCTACNTTTACPFPEADCASKCGCANNCDCPTATTCSCKPICECIEPPAVCPFKPSECAARCGCDKRCENTCNGDFCVCDPKVGCT